MPQDEEIKQWIERMQSDQLSGSELDRLLEYMEDPANEQVIRRWISDTISAGHSCAPGLSKQANKQLTDRVRELLMIKRLISPPAPIRRANWYRYPVVAAIVAAMAVAGWWFLSKEKPLFHQSEGMIVGRSVANNLNAQLILPGGRKIPLRQKTSSSTSTDRDGLIMDRTVHYANGEEVLTEAVDTLTLATPIGHDYQITLVDGSRIKLNANSRLVYPSHFTGDVRRVKLIGEGFFEINTIKRDGKYIPFVIEASDKTIEVLGTVFNISAYIGEKCVTTSLISGSVRMSAQRASESSLLKPGQRAISLVGRPAIQILDADLNADIAWTRGMFEFVDKPLADILKNLSNWYGVAFYGTPPPITYTGSLPRDKPLEEVLNILQKTGNVKFVTQANKIMVKPQTKQSMSYP